MAETICICEGCAIILIMPVNAATSEAPVASIGSHKIKPGFQMREQLRYSRFISKLPSRRCLR